MVAIFKCCGGSSLSMSRGFNLAAILTKFSGEFGSSFHDFSTTIGPRSRRDRASIVPRSGLDRDPGALSILVGSSGVDSAAACVRSRLDRAAIARFFHLVSSPSDGDPVR